jgi:DNA-binding MarR family transcriptional regulator
MPNVLAEVPRARMRNRRSEATLEVPPALNLDPVLDFMRLLWSVEHGLQSTSKRMEATLGITGPQRLILRIVAARPGLSAGALARIVHLHPSTITGILQRLIKKGLLRRERDRRDSRRIRLHSQAAANGFVTASTGTVESAVARALVRVPTHRLRHAREVLVAIAEALADDRGKSAVASKRPARKSTDERRLNQPRARVFGRNRDPR